ncbi:MAG: group II intron reverse transcriptase/maturase [Synergistaceae bacterium]|nr:group II intron reverse transcriptase/maturase [Synergistaceae bacterium]
MENRVEMRQKLMEIGRNEVTNGEAGRESLRGEEARPRNEASNTGQGLLEAILASENMQRAWKRVRENKGSAGVDGLGIAETGKYLVENWPKIREELLSGKYRPQAVKRVLIPKPGGGERELGIPTVTDRLIQQAILQVLQPQIDPKFSEHSYGFRPGRRAHDAVFKAQSYVQEGYRIVVDVDLEKFFDRVNHDILMSRVSRHVSDRRVLHLIRGYLNSGVMINGVVHERELGTPQGGPLSPLLANILLDEVDKELEKRGHRFVRYADDANVYVKSRAAGERVMQGLREMYERLNLKVNEAKSKVCSVFRSKFLGYSFWVGPKGEVKRRLSDKARKAFKSRVRQLTRRNSGKKMSDVVARLRVYLLGWKGYFGKAQTPGVFRELEEWIRHRLRSMQLKHWKRGKTMYRELLRLGAKEETALRIAGNSRRWWKNSRYLLNSVLTKAWFAEMGLPSLQ